VDIYLRDLAGLQLHLPVNPGEVTVRREKKYETINIINLGEIDFSQGEKVKEITFSSFFPKEYDISYCRHMNHLDPQEAMNRLTAWMISREPVRLMITETYIDTMVLVSAHTTSFKGGSPGDVYFDLTCRTWREVKVRTAAEVAALSGGVADQQRPREDLKPSPAIYEVSPGDSLWAIAKLLLGDGGRWSEIYEANSDLIGPDPDLILPGQRLVMPR